MLSRSEDKTVQAITDIKRSISKSSGDLVYIPLDLADLYSVKACAEDFLKREQQLHLLFNNAGVAFPERGSKTKQGYELQLGVNCIGTFALTQRLTSTLISTAKHSPKDTVRVIWVASSAVEGVTPVGYMNKLASIEKAGSFTQYATSKLGNYLHGNEFAARFAKDGVLSVSLNPGNLDSELWRTQTRIVRGILRRTVLNPPVYGAYTCLWAGVSKDITSESMKPGCFGKLATIYCTQNQKLTIIAAPWGRSWTVSKDMLNAAKSKNEGGTGAASDFWDWTEEQVSLYA
jgi:retinol dehydrogenase-12